MPVSDATICLLMKQRDRKGMEGLYEVYYKPLVVWADTFIHDVGLAEDLVQEIFIKLWEKGMLEGVEPERLKNYLYVGVRNRALNSLDKNDPLRWVGEKAIPTAVWEEYDEVKDQLEERVRAAVERLPEKSREIVKCVYWEDMKYKEVAERFGVSLATVKTLLVNSLKALRKDTSIRLDVLYAQALEYLIRRACEEGKEIPAFIYETPQNGKAAYDMHHPLLKQKPARKR